MQIRKAEAKDLEAIVEINNQYSEWVGLKDKSFFETYLKIPFFYLIEDKEGIEGFVMVMDNNTDYDSPNFAWFKERFGNFFYIDRIVIDNKAQGKGYGKSLYSLISDQLQNVPLVCEVAIEPENTGSIRFHENFGFVPIGTHTSNGKLQRMYVLR